MGLFVKSYDGVDLASVNIYIFSIADPLSLWPGPAGMGGIEYTLNIMNSSTHFFIFLLITYSQKDIVVLSFLHIYRSVMLGIFGSVVRNTIVMNHQDNFHNVR